jgi:hypothetical protein
LAEKKSMVLQELDSVIEKYTGLSRQVLNYSQLMKRLIDSSKQPGFSAASWAPLANLVATGEFVRVGNFKEVMNWQEYVGFLTNWAKGSEWECSFKRITEVPNLVFLELEERNTTAGFLSVVNSLSVYEFNEAGKIRHLDIYLQMPLPEAAMLHSYEGVNIS